MKEGRNSKNKRLLNEALADLNFEFGWALGSSMQFASKQVNSRSRLVIEHTATGRTLKEITPQGASKLKLAHTVRAIATTGRVLSVEAR